MKSLFVFLFGTDSSLWIFEDVHEFKSFGFFLLVDLTSFRNCLIAFVWLNFVSVQAMKSLFVFVSATDSSLLIFENVNEFKSFDFFLLVDLTPF